MQIPAAGMIEIAIEQLKALKQAEVDKQEKELKSALPVTDPLYINGYNLGLQVARVVLATSPLLQINNINASDLL